MDRRLVIAPLLLLCLGPAGAHGAGEPPLTAPLDLVSLAGGAGGAAVAFSRAAQKDDRTDLLWRRLDPRGQPAGPARLLRATSGRVGGVRLVRTSRGLALAWCSRTRDKGRRVHGLLWLDADGAPIGKVVQLGIDGSAFGDVSENRRDCGIDAVADGEAVVVLRPSGEARCRHEQEVARCPAFVVERVTPDGQKELLFQQGLLAPAGWPRSLTRLNGDRSYALAVADEHILNKQFVYRITGGKGGLLAELSAWNSLRLGFTGELLVGYGAIADQDRPGVAVWRGDQQVGPLKHRKDEFGNVIEVWPRLKQLVPSCRDGHPRASLTGVMEPDVTFDETSPGAGFRWADLLNYAAGAWTGEVLVLAQSGAADGNLTRAPADDAQEEHGDGEDAPATLLLRRCQGDKLVPGRSVRWSRARPSSISAPPQ